MVAARAAALASLLILALGSWSPSQLIWSDGHHDGGGVDAPLLALDSGGGPIAHRSLRNRGVGPAMFLDPKTVSLREPSALSPASASAIALDAAAADLPRAECLRSVLTEKVPALIASLNEDPEAKALRPLDVPGGKSTEHFDGLDMSAFRGKRVVMMGDSTLFYMTKWIDQLMMAQWPEGEGAVPPSWANLGLTEAASVVYERSSRHDLGLPHSPKSFPREIKYDDGTWIEWMGWQGRGKRQSARGFFNFDGNFNRTKFLRPHIIVANMAFHWLHLCPDLQCESGTPAFGEKIKLWVEYKDLWLARVHSLAVETGAELLLYKMTNFVCEEKRTGVYAEMATGHLNGQQDLVEKCFEMNKHHSESHGIALHKIRLYCERGHLTEGGAQYLNDQVSEFVNDLLSSNTMGEGYPAIGIFDDRAVEGCWSTNDSIHHKTDIMPMRIRLLANTIDAYSQCIMTVAETL